ncbi:MAG: hypothetical protein NVS4B3_08070 [Gemmatimonadaceae bacterium]
MRPPTGVAYREFTEGGRRWRVWDTLTQQPQSVRPALRAGWLTFESEIDGERRRLAPVPRGWDRGDAEQLATLCREATHVASVPALPLRSATRRTQGEPGPRPDADIEA